MKANALSFCGFLATLACFPAFAEPQALITVDPVQPGCIVFGLPCWGEANRAVMCLLGDCGVASRQLRHANEFRDCAGPVVRRGRRHYLVACLRSGATSTTTALSPAARRSVPRASKPASNPEHYDQLGNSCGYSWAANQTATRAPKRDLPDRRPAPTYTSRGAVVVRTVPPVSCNARACSSVVSKCASPSISRAMIRQVAQLSARNSAPARSGAVVKAWSFMTPGSP
jgi:hypothetical protein